MKNAVQKRQKSSSDNANMRNPAFYYTLPAAPFFMAALIGAVAARRAWLVSARPIALWACAVIVVGLGARLTRVHFGYGLGTGSQANRQAVAMLENDPKPLLTTFENCPHLSHRHIIYHINLDVPDRDPLGFHYILLDMNHQSVAQEPEKAQALLERIESSGLYATRLAEDGVYLFEKNRGVRAEQGG